MTTGNRAGALAFILCCLTARAAVPVEPALLRPPAVPLVTNDSSSSIWLPADRLNDADTVHWTGRPHRLTSLLRIDGQGFRVTGKEPASVPALPRTGLQVTPTRTIYEFAGAGVRLTLTFMSPVLPDDLNILSRPLSYVTWEVRSADGKTHQVAVHFEASPEIVVNDPSQEVETVHQTTGGRYIDVGLIDVVRPNPSGRP